MSKHRRKHKHRFILLGSGILFAIGIAFIAGIYFISFLLGPPPLSLNQKTVLYSSNGEVIGKTSELNNEEWIKLDDIANDAVQATLAIEDQHFYDHHGFDLKRIFGAVIENIKSFSLKEGASTLTQQYARNLYLTHEKTWLRKIKEAFFTIRLEMFYSKSEILEGYLNTIYYGHGAYGIEAASEVFFNKSAHELSLAESTMLAGIPKGPTYYSPFNNDTKANQRQHHILKTMLSQNKISSAEYKQAKQQRLTYRQTKEQKQTNPGAYFQDFAIQEASKVLNLNADEVRSGGYRIHTTLNKDHQLKLEKELGTTIANSSEIQASGLAIDPQTGEIIAMIGGRNYDESTFNRAIRAKRMPGSAFKPFVYYTALEHGYNATTMLMSKPTTFELSGGKVYQPGNFNGYYANKPISLAQALALSDNIYAVKTNMYVGPENVVDTAKQFGFSSKLSPIPSLALGTEVVSMKEIVRGYGMIANGGKQVDPYAVKKIVNREGETIYERPNYPQEQILDKKKTYILAHLLTGMFDHALDGYMQVTGSSIIDQLDRTYAGKSGSTDSDSWMIGFSSSIVTGIWVGYDDNRKIEQVEETSYAKDIWANFMDAAHQDLPKSSLPIPSGVIGVPVDPATGQRATPYCSSSRVMFFEKGSEPKEYCSLHFPEDSPNKTDPKPKDKSILEKVFDLFH